MSLLKRVRGLFGTTITWGAVGALVGATMFVVRYQPWSISSQYWARGVRLFGAFIAGGVLWGSACGLAFGLVIWAAARRKRFEQLSPQRFMLWGAAAGAAFPVLIYTPVVLSRTTSGLVPLYGTLTVVSAILGAGLGRLVFATAKRAPLGTSAPGALSDASILSESSVPLAARDRVH